MRLIMCYRGGFCTPFTWADAEVGGVKGYHSQLTARSTHIFQLKDGLGFISIYIQRGGTKGACKWEIWFIDCSCMGAGVMKSNKGLLPVRS